jgi:diguanylate cyclase (GGDEF)-like protein
MYLPEPLTLVVTMGLVILLTSVNYLIIWFQNRQLTALLWMLSASLLCALSFTARLILPQAPGTMIANPAILTGMACVWMGCRTASGRPPWLPSLLIPGAIWLLLACIPSFFNTPPARFATSFVLAAAILALALRELWPTSQQRRLARWFVSTLLMVQVIICLGWGVAQSVSLVRDLGIGSEMVNLPVSAFTVMGFNLILSFAFVALIKEQSDRAYWQTAQQDALTGLGNRRQLDESLERAVDSARRRGAPLAVVMIDVDQFKAYNDSYGHPAGDACLRAVAAALRGSLIRCHDEVLRYGGEEFTVLLADTGEADAIVVAERMRLAVRAMNVPHAAWDAGFVTIGLGVAVMAPGQPDTPAILDAATLIAAADRALYGAKESGRNRVVALAARDDQSKGLARRGRSAIPPPVSGF